MKVVPEDQQSQTGKSGVPVISRDRMKRSHERLAILFTGNVLSKGFCQILVQNSPAALI